MKYDYAIVGAGVAGIKLLFKLLQDPFFEKATFLLIDKDEPTGEKTLCYWEKGNGPWDALLSASWNHAVMSDRIQELRFPLNEYSYKMLDLNTLKAYCLDSFKADRRVKYVPSSVNRLKEHGEGVSIDTDKGQFEAKHVFDSRLEINETLNQGQLHIHQHFLGWYIKAKDTDLNTDAFRMMDFRTGSKGKMDFVYVLPYQKDCALVEYTVFDKHLLSKDQYEEKIRTYIQAVLKIEDYEIIKTEAGIIPMSTYPFHKMHSERVSKIGGAGGWIKPSTGYSFHNADIMSEKILHNIKTGRLPSKGIANSYQRYFDLILLSILSEENEKGPEIMMRLYQKNSVEAIFRFLDEESTPWEELKIAWSVDQALFMKHTLKQLF